MTRKYTFTEKDIEIISEARKKNKDKRAEVRLHVLQLRAEGKRSKDIAAELGVSAPYVSQLAAKYFAGGIEAISGNHYGGACRDFRRIPLRDPVPDRKTCAAAVCEEWKRSGRHDVQG